MTLRDMYDLLGQLHEELGEQLGTEPARPLYREEHAAQIESLLARVSDLEKAARDQQARSNFGALPCPQCGEIGDHLCKTVSLGGHIEPGDPA